MIRADQSQLFSKPSEAYPSAFTNSQSTTPMKLQGGKCHLPGLPSQTHSTEFRKKRPCKAQRGGAASPCTLPTSPQPKPMPPGFCISIDFCSWWARARYATHRGGKFRPGSLESSRDQRTPPKKSLPRTPIPLRAPHSPLSLARAAEPGSRVFGGCRMPSGNLGATGRPGSGQSAAEDAGQAEMSACSPASAATLLESRATLPVQGVDEGGGAARSRPARCLCKFPRESAPSRPASDLRRRELGRPRGVFCRSLARDLEPMGAAGLERSSKAS